MTGTKISAGTVTSAEMSGQHSHTSPTADRRDPSELDSTILCPRPGGGKHHSSKAADDVDPSQSYPVATREPKLRELYDQYLALQHDGGRILSREDPLVRELREVLDSLATVAGVTATSLQFDVVIEPVQNAWVISVADDVPPHVFITTGLLHALKERYGSISRGHVAFILGHELGHVVEEPHRPSFSTSTVSGDDPMHVDLSLDPSALTSQAKKVLFPRTYRREEEFKADEHAVRWMHQIGLNPKEGIEMLSYFAEQAAAAEASRSKSPRKDNIERWAVERVLSTHPDIVSRLSRLKGVGHSVLVDQLGQKGTFGLLQDGSKIPLETQDCPRLTAVQQSMSDLSKKFASSIRHGKPVDWDDVKTYVSTLCRDSGQVPFEDRVNLLRHVYVILPMLGRLAEGAMPFLPGGVAGSPPADFSYPLGTGISNQRGAEALEAAFGELCKEVEKTFEEQMHKSGEAERARLMIMKGCYFDAIYPFPNGAYEKMLAEVCERVTEQSPTILQSIQEFGQKYLDFSCFDKSLLKIIPRVSRREELGLEGHGVTRKQEDINERGSALDNLVRDSSIDVRKTLLATLFQKGQPLDGLELSSVRMWARYVGDLVDSEVLPMEVGEALGEHVAMWLLDSDYDLSDPGDRAKVKEFLSGLSRPAADSSLKAELESVVLGVLMSITADDVGEEDGFFRCIKELGPNGPTSDAAILKHWWQSSDDLRLLMVSQLHADSMEDHGVVDAFGHELCSVLSMLDLSWYDLHIEKGDLRLLDNARARACLPVEEPDPLAKFTYMSLVTLSGPRTHAGSIVRAIVSATNVEGVIDNVVAQAFKGGENHPLHGLIIEMYLSHFQLEWGEERVQYSMEASLGERMDKWIQTKGSLQDTWKRVAAIDTCLVTYSKDTRTEPVKRVLSCLPSGEFRDQVVLKYLAKLIVQRSKKQKLTENSPEYHEIPHTDLDAISAQELLQLLRWREAEVSPIDVVTQVHRYNQLNPARQAFENYYDFLRIKFGLDVKGQVPNPEAFSLDLLDTASIGRMVSSRLFTWFESERYESTKESMSPGDRVELLDKYFVYPSEEKDRMLQEVISSVDRDRGATSNDSFQIREKVHPRLFSPHIRSSLGRDLYARWLQSDAGRSASFDDHLAKVIHYHEPGSVAMDLALRGFFDGTDSRDGHACSWEERSAVVQALKDGEKVRGLRASRTTALQLLQELPQQDFVPPIEKVAVLLWLADIRRSCHLVDCLELTEGLDRHTIKKDKELLTEAEKRRLISDILAGPKGILRLEEGAARQQFLDALFAAVFDEDKITGDNRRAFKAVFDCMLANSTPERAAGYLSHFLVSHIDGQDFGQQVKLFFTSFGFVGVKTAQYLATRTALLSPEIRDALMDLTSRVPGPDKRIVFDALERVLGEDSGRAVQSIGNRLGGGSLMSFYEVTLWNEDRTGPGRSGVVGILRSDILAALPEDLAVVRSVVDTMEGCPQIFGGKTVSQELVNNLMSQSAIETNLIRTARLQEVMREDVKNMRVREAGVSVTVPEIWRNVSVEGKDVELTRGPLVFMDRGSGVTLDQFLKTRGAESKDGKKVLNTLCDLLTHQLAQGRVVHCDLHPGNVLVSELEQGLQITILDVGLSAEVDREVMQQLGRIVRFVAGGRESGKKVGITDIFKSAFGVESISSDKGKHWLGRFITSIGARNSKLFSSEQLAEATDSLWKVLTTPNMPLQERITGFISQVESLGVTLPSDFYYLSRGLGVSSYVWEHADPQRQLALLNAIPAETMNKSTEDRRNVIERIAGLIEKAGGSFNRKAADRMFDELDTLDNLPDQLRYIVNNAKALSRGVSEDAVFEMIVSDSQLPELLGIPLAADLLSGGTSDDPFTNEALQLLQSTYTGSKEQLKERAETEHWGMMPKVWRDILQPGSVLRERTKSCDVFYRIQLFNPAATAPDEIPVGEVKNRKQPTSLPCLLKRIDKDWDGAQRKIDDYDPTEEVPLRVDVRDFNAIINKIDKPSSYSRETVLGDLLNSGREVEVLRDSEWVPLPSFLYTKGETLREYLRDVQRWSAASEERK